MVDQREARQQWQNRVNNAQGHIFEDGIKEACRIYHSGGRAEVDKTPEPFRVCFTGAVLFLDYVHITDAAAAARNYIAEGFCATARERSA